MHVRPSNSAFGKHWCTLVGLSGIKNKKLDPFTGAYEPDQLPFSVWCDMNAEGGVGTAVISKFHVEHKYSRMKT